VTKLTDLAVKNAKPKLDKKTGKPVRNEVSDNGSGLLLIVQPSGHKSYATRTRLNGDPIKITHGDADALSLADARVLNAEAIKQAKKGVNPNDVKKQAKAKRAVAEANTFEAIALLYLDSTKVKKLRTADQLTRRLTRLVFPQIGDKPIVDVRRPVIMQALRHIERDSGSRTRDLCLSDISGVLKFYALEYADDDYTLPLVPGMKRLNPKEQARDRTLTDDEIKKLWATGNRFAQFLLLTSARRDEAASMQFKELSGNDWTLPAARNKTKVELIRPLSKAAMDVLPPRGDDDEYVFGNTPDRPLSSFSLLKSRLDKASGVTGWRFHDLRRTAKTLMSRAGLKAHGEHLLGHVLKGVEGIYDKHDYYAEKKQALAALAKQINKIISPPKPKRPRVVRPPKGGNVYQLRRAYCQRRTGRRSGRGESFTAAAGTGSAATRAASAT
jgi:integrase